MRRNTTCWMAVAVLLVPALNSALWAAPPTATTITVPDMHCMGCAKKMAAKLYEVPGVEKVEADVPTTTLIVSPKAQKNLSPRALWEAVEKAGYKPAKLVGPSGTFQQKPQT